MPFFIVKNDITKMKTDAIVNASNISLSMGGGVCGAIFHAAGSGDLQRACNEIGTIKTGEAVITAGFNLKANYIIHTAGPRYSKKINQDDLLYKCYWNSLKLAKDNDCESISFPLISSGIYGYPKALAIKTAKRAILDYLKEHDMTVYLVVFDFNSYIKAKSSSQSIDRYLKDNLDEKRTAAKNRRLMEFSLPNLKEDLLGNKADEEMSMEDADEFDKTPLHPFPMASEEKKPVQSYSHSVNDKKANQDVFAIPNFAEIDKLIAKESAKESICSDMSISEMLANMDASFSDMTKNLMVKKGMDSKQIYKRANMTRQHFSKINCNTKYIPSKPTVFALAIAMELSLSETTKYLKAAGFALSHSSVFDVIIEYHIVNGIYDIFAINDELFKYDQPLLGAKM